MHRWNFDPKFEIEFLFQLERHEGVDAELVAALVKLYLVGGQLQDFGESLTNAASTTRAPQLKSVCLMWTGNNGAKTTPAASIHPVSSN